MEIKNIIVHHTGGTLNNPYAKTSDESIVVINKAHRARGFNLSEAGFYVGYSFFINKSGELTQTRLIGEETCGARGFNFDSIHICLAGNFTIGVEAPALEQKMRLKNLLRQLTAGNFDGLKIKDGTKLNLSTDRINPHRHYGQTECYGTSLSDNWARGLVSDNLDLEKQEKIRLLTQLIDIYKSMLKLLQARLGSQSPTACQPERG